MERGLETMKEGKTGPVSWMLDGIQDHIMRGGTLWEGMDLFPKYFDQFQVMIIKAAEKSGKLPEVCQGLTHYYEMRLKEKRRLIAGMIYPVVLLHAVILLPPLKYLVVSGRGPSYWSVVLPPLLIAYFIVGLGYFAWRGKAVSQRVRDIWDETLMRLPLIGKVTKGFALSRVFRAMANLVNAGVGVVQAASQAASTAGNAAISFRLTGALPILEQGGTMSDYFSFSGILTSAQQSMISIGEQSGALVESMEKMAVQIEEDTTHRFSKAIKTFGVVAYIIAAFIAALAIISFYGGYFKVG